MIGAVDLLLAAEGGAEHGLGHVMRCAALAIEARNRGLRIAIALRGDAAARDVLASESLAAAVRPWTSRLFPPGVAASAVVFDARGAIAPALHEAAASGARTLVLDRLDLQDVADWTVLPGVHGAPVRHPRVRQGASWCVIAPELRSVRRAAFELDRHRALVTLGGADPRCLTARVADELAAALGPDGASRVDVVLGAAFRDVGLVARQLAERGFVPHLAPTRRRLAALAGRAAFAVCGFGTTVYELAFLGVPMLYLTHREADVEDARRLEGLGIGRFAGCAAGFAPERLREALDAAALAPAWRRASAARGRALLDEGGGAARILDLLVPDAVVRRQEAS